MTMDLTVDLKVDIEKRFASGTTIRGAFHAKTDGSCVTVLFGPSGCGKTTVLRCLAGLERPEAGRIAWGEEVWFDAARSIFMTPQRRGVGYLFQDYALFPHLTVAGNVAFGLRDRNSPAARRIIAEVLDLLQIADLLDSYPAQLSGGQRQRVSLMRALMLDPELLLLDEPLGALDPLIRAELQEDLKGIFHRLHKTVVLVTHDLAEAGFLGDRLVLLQEGRMVQQAPYATLVKHPASAFVERFIHAQRGMEGVGEGKG